MLSSNWDEAACEGPFQVNHPVLGRIREARPAVVSRTGQRRYRDCAQRRSVRRETTRGEAMEGSGLRSIRGCGRSRRKYISRRLYGSFPVGGLCVALFSEEIA